jgi:hypothetical protein
MGRRGRQIVEERYNISLWASVLDDIMRGSLEPARANAPAARKNHTLEPALAA